jgi:Uma2 family endonuclease
MGSANVDPAVLEEILAGSPAETLAPLTVDQYHEMTAAGIVEEGEPVELIRGYRIRKNRAKRGEDPTTHGHDHAKGVRNLERLGRRLEPLGFHMRVQLPVTVRPNSEPEPDGAVTRGPENAFDRAHPEPPDVLVAVEVADSSLRRDRGKAALYSAAGIPVYWIVNIPDGQIEIYDQPIPAQERYARRVDRRRGETVRIDLGPAGGVDVAVNELLPPAEPASPAPHVPPIPPTTA